MNYERPELQQRLAAEYVLGTLHGHARKRFQRLLAKSPALTAAVAFWERELVPMASPLSVPHPGAHVWEGIAARVAPAAHRAPQPGFFERFFGMRTLGPLAAGLVLGIGVMVVAPMLRDAIQPNVAGMQLPESYAGFLQDRDGNVALLVSSLRHGRIVDVKVLRPVTVAPDRVLQLWALSDDKPPLSLGVIPAQGKGSFTLPATSDELLAKVRELAVSVEPKTGTPAAQPTEPFLLRGVCAKFW